MSIEIEKEKLRKARAVAHFEFMEAYARVEELERDLENLKIAIPKAQAAMLRFKRKRNELDAEWEAKDYDNLEKLAKIEKVKRIKAQLAKLEAELE